LLIEIVDCRLAIKKGSRHYRRLPCGCCGRPGSPATHGSLP